MKNAKFFEVFALINDSLESVILQCSSAREAKYLVEKNWREYDMYDYKVVKVVPSSYSEFISRQ